MKQLKEYNKRAHFEICKGWKQDNINYCKKEGNFTEMGCPKEQGRRNDLHNLKEIILNGDYNNFGEFLADNTDMDVRNLNWCEKLFSYKNEINLIAQKKEALLKYKPTNKMQEHIVNVVESVPDSRAVHWIYDNEGNTGKTYTAKNYLVPKGALYVSGGKVTDILHAYNNQDIIAIDLPRTCEDLNHIYTAIEQLKNGIMFWGKYNSSTKMIYKNVTLIVFANFFPKVHMLWMDRWRIYDAQKMEQIPRDNYGNYIY